MSVRESVAMEAMLSGFLVVSGLAISFLIVGNHLCWTCRAFGSQGCWMSAGVAGGHSSVLGRAGLGIGCLSWRRWRSLAGCCWRACGG